METDDKIILNNMKKTRTKWKLIKKNEVGKKNKYDKNHTWNKNKK